MDPKISFHYGPYLNNRKQQKKGNTTSFNVGGKSFHPKINSHILLKILVEKIDAFSQSNLALLRK